MRFNPSYFKLHMRWLRSFTPVTYQSQLLGINERLLPLTGGQPSAGQIRSRRICHSLAAFLQLELFRVDCRCVEYIIR
ncbi:hypothetical protein CWN68_05335 [Klebsiella michiganensis]|nr:hypothetical protein CWN68_05335 [Klebsiella michiganensis]